jgi:ABC-2 type transport system permease protein
MKTIKDLWIIARKDLLEFSRDRLRLVTFFIMPVFMMIMTGFIFPNQNSIKNVPIGIADESNSAMSQKLVSVISDLKIGDNSDNAFVITTYSNADEIKEAIKSQEISGGIDIPKDFADNIAQNEQSKVTIVENQAKPQISQMVTAVLTQVVSGFSQGVGTQKLDQILVNESKVEGTSPSIISPLAIMQPITAKLEGIISGNPNYFEFVAPGIVAMIVMTAVLTGLAASVSREKEQGTLDGILISPINRLSIILGKALSQAIRGLVQGAMVLLLAYLLFGVTIHGNLLLIALILFAGIFSFVGFGILVSSIASEQETATQLLFMFQFPMLFLSGVFFPIELMPKIMQYISKAIPLTYAIDALRKVMVLGASISAVRYELVVLLIFGVVTLAISVPVFNKVITK